MREKEKSICATYLRKVKSIHCQILQMDDSTAAMICAMNYVYCRNLLQIRIVNPNLENGKRKRLPLPLAT